MAGEEEDYMGDLSQFLPPEHDSLPSTPSSHKVVSSNKTKTLIPQPSKNKPNFSNWQEHRKLKRAKQQHQEDQQTLANIESAILQSNIGFKMLKQMGYTPGSSLGKEGSGRAEPVGLEIRRGRGGLGREDPEKERMRKEEMRARKEEMRVMGKRVEEDVLMAEFGCRLKEHWRSRRVVVNFRKAKGVLAQLGNEEVVEEEEKNKEGEDGGGDEEEEKEAITEEDLRNVLVKLRDEFHYCLFCGCQYESMEALLLNCPGTDEDDH